MFFQKRNHIFAYLCSFCINHCDLLQKENNCVCSFIVFGLVDATTKERKVCDEDSIHIARRAFFSLHLSALLSPSWSSHLNHHTTIFLWLLLIFFIPRKWVGLVSALENDLLIFWSGSSPPNPDWYKIPIDIWKWYCGYIIWMALGVEILAVFSSKPDWTSSLKHRTESLA